MIKIFIRSTVKFKSTLIHPKNYLNELQKLPQREDRRNIDLIPVFQIDVEFNNYIKRK